MISKIPSWWRCLVVRLLWDLLWTVFRFVTAGGRLSPMHRGIHESAVKYHPATSSLFISSHTFATWHLLSHSMCFPTLQCIWHSAHVSDFLQFPTTAPLFANYLQLYAGSSASLWMQFEHAVLAWTTERTRLASPFTHSLIVAFIQPAVYSPVGLSNNHPLLSGRMTPHLLPHHPAPPSTTRSNPTRSVLPVPAPRAHSLLLEPHLQEDFLGLLPWRLSGVPTASRPLPSARSRLSLQEMVQPPEWRRSCGNSTAEWLGRVQSAVKRWRRW